MKDKLVDEYIAKAAPFAQPIMKKLRALVHKACPAMTEELKWNAPAFMHHGIVIGMVAFKAHVRFGFWRARELEIQITILHHRGTEVKFSVPLWLIKRVWPSPTPSLVPPSQNPTALHRCN